MVVFFGHQGSTYMIIIISIKKMHDNKQVVDCIIGYPAFTCIVLGFDDLYVAVASLVITRITIFAFSVFRLKFWYAGHTGIPLIVNPGDSAAVTCSPLPS
jgi:hypothetical protein